jgi:hypothetical protein
MHKIHLKLLRAQKLQKRILWPKTLARKEIEDTQVYENLIAIPSFEEEK